MREGPEEVSACTFNARYTQVVLKADDVYFVIRRSIIGVINVKLLEVRAVPTTNRIYIVRMNECQKRTLFL